MSVPEYRDALCGPKSRCNIESQNIAFQRLKRNEPFRRHDLTNLGNTLVSPGLAKAQTQYFALLCATQMMCDFRKTSCRISRSTAQFKNEVGAEFLRKGGNLCPLRQREIARTTNCRA